MWSCVQHAFKIFGRPVRLWQNPGESFDHVLLKAVGFAMFARDFPHLEIERRVGLRYKPDLVALSSIGGFVFWGECGINSVRKTAWVLKHANTQRLVLFKMNAAAEQLASHLRGVIPERYRVDGRLAIVNFCDEIRDLTVNRQIAKVPDDLFTQITV
jgi:hypothetical protein